MITNELKTDFDLIIKKVEIERDGINKLLKLDNLNKLIDFLIIGEDRRFYNHKGFDVIAIIRAIRNKIFYSKNEGASTIEQQLVRVLTNQYKKSYKRKLKEIILATMLKKLCLKKKLQYCT